MFRPRAFDCDVEPQLTSADVFYSVIPSSLKFQYLASEEGSVCIYIYIKVSMII